MCRPWARPTRDDPATLFDETLSDLYVVRSAGNVADKPRLASLEYAAENLQALVDELSPPVTAAAEVVERSPPVRKQVEAGPRRLWRGIDALDSGPVRWPEDDQARAEAPLPPPSRVLADLRACEDIAGPSGNVEARAARRSGSAFSATGGGIFTGSPRPVTR